MSFHEDHFWIAGGFSEEQLVAWRTAAELDPCHEHVISPLASREVIRNDDLALFIRYFDERDDELERLRGLVEDPQWRNQ
jgi:hypothetical protein